MPKPQVAPTGYSPTWLPGGLPQYGVNPDLYPLRWRGYAGMWGTVDLMLQTDGLIAASASARVQGLQDLRRTVRPASDEVVDVEIAQWVDDMLSDIDGGWESWVADAGLYALRGALYYEHIYRRDDAGRWVLAALLPRPLRTVSRWEGDGYRWGMWQWTQPSASWMARPSGQVFLPADRLVGLRWRPEGDDPEPIGQLRACYGAWTRRGSVWIKRTDAIDRGAYGVPRVEVDTTAPGYDQTQADKAQQMAMMSRADPFAAELWPAGYKLALDPWPIAIDGMSGANKDDGYEIAQALGTVHLLTGQHNGTEALVREQVLSIFDPAVRADARVLCAALQPIINALCASAYPGRRPPRLLLEQPQDLTLAERIDRVMTAVQTGVLTDTSGAIAVWLRGALDVPQDEAEVEEDTDDDTPSGEVETATSPESDPEPEEDDDAEDAPDDEPEAVAAEGVGLIDPLVGAPPAPAIDPSDVLARFADDCLTVGPGGRPVALAERSIRASETVVPLRGLQRRATDALVAWTASIADDFGAAVAEQAERWPDGDAVASAALPPELEASLRATLADLYGDAYESGRLGAKAEIRRITRDPAAVARVVEDVRERPVAALADGGCRCGRPHGAARGFDVILAADPQQPAPRRSVRGGAGTIARLNAPELIERWVSEVARDNMQRIQTASRRVLDALGPGGSLRGVPFDVVRDAVRDAIEALSTGETGAQATGPVNTMFSLGRMQEQIASGADRWLYSTSIESNRCEPCIDHDLTLVGPEDLDTYSTPASWCLGGDRCNCLLIAVPSDQLPADLREVP